WVAALLRRADDRARIASRTIGLFVALLSFAVAAVGVIRYFVPGLGESVESWGLLLSGTLLLAVALGGFFLMWAAGHARDGGVWGPAPRSRWEWGGTGRAGRRFAP